MKRFNFVGSVKFLIAVFIMMTGTFGLPFIHNFSAVNADQEMTQKITKEFKTPPGGKLILNLEAGGEISVTGWAQQVVVIKASIQGADWKNYQIGFSHNEAEVTVNSSYRVYRLNNHTNATFNILVPQKFNLEINSAGGNIILKNIEGVISGETAGGKLELSKLTGTLYLTTMGGDINVKESVLDGEVKTMGGQVLIENLTGGLKGTTMGGKVVYKNVTGSDNRIADNNLPETEEVHISTMGGPIEVESAPVGAEVKTMGGNIHIHFAAKFVKANTMGGNINIDTVDGWVEATTMGGDVKVMMTGDPGRGRRDIVITSMGGDIFLTVPPALSMNVDITLAYTENRQRDYSIMSDFPIKIQKTSDWDYSRVTARKYIYGTGRIAGGKNKIKIETINGNVTLKKGKR